MDTKEVNTSNEVVVNHGPLEKAPKTNKEAWLMYSKLNWVYDSTRIYDSQNIPWSPFKIGEYHLQVPIFTFEDCITPINVNNFPDASEVPGHVFIPEIKGKHLFTDAVIVKGDVKWMRHYTSKFESIDDIKGDIELRTGAFAAMHLQKYAGVINVETIGNVIVAIRLKPTYEMISQYGEDWIKKVERVYNKKVWK